MAIKRGRKSSKVIGDRRQRKSLRRQSAASSLADTKRHNVISEVLKFDISEVLEDNRQRLSETVAQRAHVVHTTFKPVGQRHIFLFVEINLTWVPASRHDNIVKTLVSNIERDIKHRVVHPERINA